jgi:hypothetical protein
MAARQPPQSPHRPAPLYALPPNGYGVPMLRLIQAPNIAIATLWADLLCEAGMTASVQRQYLGAVAGHLPPDQCLPEIWLDYAEHEQRARDLLQELQNLPQRRWLCHCGEMVEGGFEQCWHCGQFMPR